MRSKKIGDHSTFAVATIEIRWKEIVQRSTKGDIFIASPGTAVQLGSCEFNQILAMLSIFPNLGKHTKLDILVDLGVK